MGRRALVGALCVGLLAACSGGGGGSAATTTTSSRATSTTKATTSTTTPEEAVKTAYLAYWKMIDRLFASPDPDDAELARAAVDPILSFLKDDLTTRRSEGRTTRFPTDPALNSHRIDLVAASGTTATVTDCFVDGRIAVAGDGSTNDSVVTKTTRGSLVRDGDTWKVSDVQFIDHTNGRAGCAAQ